MELGLSRSFRIQKQNDDTQIFGRVIVHRGRIDVMGRRFDVQADSTLRWTGPSDRPELDVRGDPQERAGECDGSVDGEGTARQADDCRDLAKPTRADRIAALHAASSRGGCNWPAAPPVRRRRRRKALSLLGGVVASQLQKTLAGKLPLDVLTISTPAATACGARSWRPAVTSPTSSMSATSGGSGRTRSATRTATPSTSNTS